jgi:hypothetical protein
MLELTQYSIAGAMTQDLESRRALRSIFLLIIITTVVAICLTVTSLRSNWETLVTRFPSQRPLRPGKDKLLQVLVRLDFFSFISGSIALIYLQSALYIGTTQSWNSSRAITLLTAGFVVSSALFIFQQSATDMLPAIIPMRALNLRQVVNTVCIAFWSFIFYSYSFLTRELYCHFWKDMADHS